MTRIIHKTVAISLALSLMAMALASCGGTPVSEVHSLKIKMAAAADVNPDMESRPSPIILHILELSSIDQFNRADYFSLTRDDAASLGGDVLNKTEIILTPGASKQTELELNVQTSFLGFVAGYRDIDRSQWRVTQEVAPGKTDWVSVNLEKQKITIIEVND
ncbi:MAG: type VI secretion system lipoprotein TssJ [Xanthomonadales bacterium]|jgi:type VI secretion system protein VasD|nr:type VI secretion system lipoprotein TssJ [Xanthomonadales bacterium]